MVASSTVETSLARCIGEVAAVLASDGFPTAERAALRRMSPTQPPPLAFYRFALRHLPEGWDADRDALKDWIAIVGGIALMSPRAHRPDRGLGQALAEAGFAEARLERLLAAEGDARRLLLLRAVRFLAAKGIGCNWVDAARLLLIREPERREGLHRRIARDYFGAATAIR